MARKFIKSGVQATYGTKAAAREWAEKRADAEAAKGRAFMYSVTHGVNTAGKRSRSAGWLVYWDLWDTHDGNPPELLVFGTNPGGRARKLGKAHELKYMHATEGARVHEFDGDEVIELLRDGSVRIYHPQGKRLWAVMD